MRTLILAAILAASADAQYVPPSGGGGGGATIPSTTNIIKGNGSGNGADSGIVPANVPLLDANNVFTGTQTIGAMVLVPSGPGTFQVREKYGAVPDGSTDNSTAIAAAFTASNAYTVGVPTVYFDCPQTTTVCKYNYGGSGISPINPLRATTIMCAPGATLNYTGSAHAADFGPTNLTQADEEIYTVQGCRWTGGASMTAGLYWNNYVVNPHIVGNHFWNFGNRTGYTIIFPANNWMPIVALNRWTDTDGFSKNMVDAHAGTNVGLDFSLNKSECTTSGGGACSVSTVGVGLWLATGRVIENEIKFHAPLIRISNCSGGTCGGGQGFFISHNLLEGNTNQPGPAITFGDPGTAGAHIGSGVVISDNNIYWPGASTVPTIGPEAASSGSFQLDRATLANNQFTANPSGGAVFANLNQGVNSYIANNRGPGGVPITAASTIPIIDAGYSTQNSYFSLQSFLGFSGTLANAMPVFDSAGVNIGRASYHSMVGPVTCADSSGSGTVQACDTTPKFDAAGGAITAAAGDTILYKTTTTNTGDVTIAVNGGSAVHVRKNQGSATLAAGDLKSGVYIPLTFDGTYWEIGSLGNAGAGATIASTSAPIKGDGAGNGIAAAAADIVGLFSTCSGTQYLGADGACHSGTASYPSVVANIDQTGKTANITTAVFYAVPSGKAGTYRATCYSVVTTAASSTSTLPACQVGWTDADTSVTQTGVSILATSANNTVGTSGTSWNCSGGSSCGGNIVIHVAQSTNITYQTNAYASSGGTAMVYAVHLVLEYLGP